MNNTNIETDIPMLKDTITFTISPNKMKYLGIPLTKNYGCWKLQIVDKRHFLKDLSK